MEPALREVALVKGEVDAITAFYGSGWFGLTRNNVPPEEIITFMYTDYGLPLYGNAVMASPAYLAANAEAVKGFMRGLARGWQDSLADPAAAVEIIKRREPLVDAEVELQRLQLAIDRHFLNDEVRQNGFGAVDPARLARSIELVAQGFELSPVPTADSVFSDAYLLAQRATHAPPINLCRQSPRCPPAAGRLASRHDHECHHRPAGLR